jgi:chromosome partitioning protein
MIVAIATRRRRRQNDDRDQPRRGAGLRGKRTLLIDLDPRPTARCRFSTCRRARGAVATRSPIPPCPFDVIVPSPVENLFVAPSRIALAKLEAKLVGEMDAHFGSRTSSSRFGTYPHVVIDARRRSGC